MNQMKTTIKGFSHRLEKAGVFTPEKDALSIVLHAMGMGDRPDFEIEGLTFSDETLAIAESYIKRRERREPLHRILGRMTFCGLNIQVVDGVFRPCPEVERLVEIAESCVEGRAQDHLRILDLGTGTGCLLLGLLNRLPNATGVGVDIHDHILNAAKKNADDADLSDRAQFQLSDWGRDVQGAFDLVLCNPPTITSQDLIHYPPEMRDHNPMESMDGGIDGLRFYKAIVKDFDRLVKPGGVGVFMAYSERREASVFEKAGFPVQVKRNYAGQVHAIVVAHEMSSRSWLSRMRQRFGL